MGGPVHRQLEDRAVHLRADVGEEPTRRTLNLSMKRKPRKSAAKRKPSQTRSKQPPIPRTLDEAVDQLVARCDPDGIAKLKEHVKTFGVDVAMSNTFFGGGMAMRNEWGLWRKTGPLNKWFRANGIWHGDDKSAIIFKTFACRVGGETLDIAKEAAHYADFWLRTAGQGFDGKQVAESPHTYVVKTLGGVVAVTDAQPPEPPTPKLTEPIYEPESAAPWEPSIYECQCGDCKPDSSPVPRPELEGGGWRLPKWLRAMFRW